MKFFEDVNNLVFVSLVNSTKTCKSEEHTFSTFLRKAAVKKHDQSQPSTSCRELLAKEIQSQSDNLGKETVSDFDQTDIEKLILNRY